MTSSEGLAADREEHLVGFIGFQFFPETGFIAFAMRKAKRF
jgi:hypothetical protein